MTKNITVIDSIMGSGKTTYIVNRINKTYERDIAKRFSNTDHKPRRYLVVVPLLTEVTRLQQQCSGLNFKDPQPIHGHKLYHLDKLIEDGDNIVTTHALFRLLNRKMYEQLKQQSYTLIIDEALECVEIFTGLKPADKEILFETGMVYVDAVSRRLVWNAPEYPDEGKYGDIKNLCNIGSLVVMDDKVLVQEFPSEFLKCFDEVIVCTYLFHGSVFCAYLTAEGFTFDMKSIYRGEMVRWDPWKYERETKAALRELITIYQGPMNGIGQQTGKKNPLSSSWYKSAKPEELKRLKSSTETFFGRYAETPSAKNGWTTYSDYKKHVKGKGFAKGWIPNNAKATNDYIDKQSMAYLCNWYFNPMLNVTFLSEEWRSTRRHTPSQRCSNGSGGHRSGEETRSRSSFRLNV